MELLRRLAVLGVASTVVTILVTTLTPVAVDRDGCAFGLPCTLGHALAFGALGVTLAALYVTSRFARRHPQRAIVMLLLCVWILAAGTEIAQGYVGRDPSLEDWAADMAGAIAGLLVGGFALRTVAGPRLPLAVPVTAPGTPRRRARR